MREDRSTTTPEDAAWFERHRGGGYGAPDDDTSMADVIGAEGSDNGAGLPTNLAALRAMQRLDGQGVHVLVIRERVLSLKPHRTIDPDAIAAALAPDFEVREHEGTWFARPTDDYWTTLTGTFSTDPWRRA